MLRPNHEVHVQEALRLIEEAQQRLLHASRHLADVPGFAAQCDEACRLGFMAKELQETAFEKHETLANLGHAVCGANCG